MNREELKNILPHREPMLLVDNVELDGEWVNATYTVKGDEHFLQGHFPGMPVVPGVILCEIMAQSCCLLISDLLKENLPLYAGIDKARFKHPAVPGDTISIRATVTQRKGKVVFVEAASKVNDKLCCSGNFSFVLIPKPNNN